MSLSLSEKCTKITPSATLALTARVNKMKEEGVPVIGMAAGEPDFNTPLMIANAAHHAIDTFQTRYTAVAGILPLRTAIAEKLNRTHPFPYSASQVLVTAGAKQALFEAFCAILNEGDEVLVPSPCWVSYPEMIALSGGKAILVKTKPENRYIPQISDLESALTPHTKALLINSPNNPTGSVLRPSETNALCGFAKEHDLWIISDEIYSNLLYAGAQHTSLSSVSEDAYMRTIMIDGFSKTYAMTGWRIGYAAGPEKVIKAMTAFQSHTSGNANSITQYAALDALKEDPAEMSEMLAAFSNRREIISTLASEIPGVRFHAPEGAFYLFLNIFALLPAHAGEKMLLSASDFAEALLDKEYVALVPCESFDAPGCIRLSFAIDEKNIREAMKRLKRFVLSLQKKC